MELGLNSGIDTRIRQSILHAFLDGKKVSAYFVSRGFPAGSPEQAFMIGMYIQVLSYECAYTYMFLCQMPDPYLPAAKF